MSIKTFRILKCFVILTVIMLTNINQLLAAQISLSAQIKSVLRIEAGLDDQTRSLIDKMPLNIKNQIYKLIEEALPLVDKSVIKYLNRVDEILSQQLSAVDCSLAGWSKTTVEELLTGIKPFKDHPTMVEDLKKSAEKLNSRFKSDTTQDKFRTYYGDILAHARTTACAVQGTQVAYDEVMELRAKLMAGVLPWQKLKNEPCNDAKSCLLRSKTIVENEIKAADTRDVTQVNADTRLAEIKIPEEGFFSKFNYKPYSIALTSVYKISDEVRILGALRQAEADAMMKVAYDKINYFESIVKEAQRLKATGYDGKKQAQTILGTTSNINDFLKNEIPKIVDLLPSQKEAGDQILNRSKSANEIKITLNEQLGNEISQQEAVWRKECSYVESCSPPRNPLCPNRSGGYKCRTSDFH
jgi:hypothetical protein